MSQETVQSPLRVAVLTVSDTRTEDTDKGGNTVIRMMQGANHTIVQRRIVKDDKAAIQQAVTAWIHDSDVDVIVTTGGTGIAKRDVTIESVTPLLDKEIPGFGEIFRYYSVTQDIGTRAIASRAVAGVANDTLVFSIPGSVGAVTLALELLIIPEIAHLVYEVRKTHSKSMV